MYPRGLKISSEENANFNGFKGLRQAFLEFESVKYLPNLERIVLCVHLEQLQATIKVKDVSVSTEETSENVFEFAKFPLCLSFVINSRIVGGKDTETRLMA